MKTKILFTIFLSLVLGVNAFSQDSVARAFRDAGIRTVNKRTVPPDFTLQKLDGSSFTLSQQKGKVVFLNFWATWCPPCRHEMPSMEALYQRLKSRGFEIVAVNLHESNSAVSAFMKQNNLSFPAVLDSRGVVGSLYNARSIPTTYIIDRQGRITAHLVGAIDWNAPKVIAAFEALLAE